MMIRKQVALFHLSKYCFFHETYFNFETCLKSVSMRKPGRTRQEVIQLKPLISLKLGTNVGFGE